MFVTAGSSVSGEPMTVRVYGEIRDSGSIEGGGTIAYMLIVDTD